MSRVQKTNKLTKLGERYDFKFSNLKALQVPKGWDRLFVTVVSVESGKAVAKTGRAFVRNGSCQWAEVLSESIWVSQKEPAEEMEDCLLKLVVTMGSARSGVLGESTMNMADYTNQGFSTAAVSLPLKKCNHGTILQLKVHCLTPRAKNRDNNMSKGINSNDQVSSADSNDIDFSSEKSEDILARMAGSSSRKGNVTMSPQEQRGNGESSSSTSDPYHNHSYDSVESSQGKENFSPWSNSNPNELNSNSAQSSLPEGTNHLNGPSRSDHLSFDLQMTAPERNSEGNQLSSFRATGFSKNLLEVAEKTIEELHAEAKMWKRNAQKLMLDLEILKKECSDHPNNQANLEMELAVANAERDVLRNEVEQLKVLLEKSAEQQTNLEDKTLMSKELSYIQKEYMEDEIKFQKESNANLALQLKKSQDANVELLSVLQEQQETIEQQRAEIQKVSALQSQFQEMENTTQQNIEESKGLIFQLQRSEESEKTMHAKIKILEQALQENDQNIEQQKVLLDIETEYKNKLAAKEREIITLRAKLSESLREKQAQEMEPKNQFHSDLMREINELREKLEDLERDCDELTNENLELLIRIKETDNKSSSEESEDRYQMHCLEEKLKKKIPKETEENYYAQELEIFRIEMEAKATKLLEELSQKRTEVQKLEASLLSKDNENAELRGHQSELEARISDLHKQKDQMENRMEAVLKESDIASKCLDDLRKDLMVMSSSLDSHVSANKILERKSSELEKDRCELEMHLAKLANENEQLLEHISDLEAQLMDLKDKSDSTRLQLQNSESHATNLEDEITKLRNEIESQNTEMKEQLQDMHNRLLESQKELECLRRVNSGLQTSAETLTVEYNSLRKSNEELMKEKMELHDHCAKLEEKLRESCKSFTDCSERVKSLEETLSSVQESAASRTESLMSEVNAIFDKNKKLEEKLKLKESSWNQMYFEKTNEVVKLQKEIKKLTEQLVTKHKERDSVAHEISGLHADKVKLESALEEAKSRISSTESEINTIKIEAKGKIDNLMGELAASNQRQGTLNADYEKVLKLLEHYKSEEEKLKTTVNDLELKLTVSEYEQQQLSEKSTKMKAQMLKIEDIEEEICTLRNELDTSKCEKKKLEALFSQISREREDLQREKNSLMGNISSLQNAANELEDLKHGKAALEEKLLQLENDLKTRDALSALAAELRNELGQTKRTNRQFRQKIQQLEQEKVELLRRSESLEEKLKLVEAMEAGNMYRHRLNRFSSEGRKSQSNSPRKQASIEGESMSKERYEHTKSTLETELRDIQERYYQMSLKYAEVEEQREELIMKLRAARTEKRWF